MLVPLKKEKEKRNKTILQQCLHHDSSERALRLPQPTSSSAQLNSSWRLYYLVEIQTEAC